MPYAYKLTWPDKPDDYVFLHDGKDAGRCYLTRDTLINDRKELWLWTIYVGLKVKAVPPGIPITGREESFEAAREAFKRSFDRLIEAGAA